MAWQTTLTLVIAVAIGARSASSAAGGPWHALAGSLGAEPVSEVPLLLLVLGECSLIRGTVAGAAA
jgi:hypothetical protein